MAASTGDKITDVRNAARPNSARATGTRSSGGASLACDNLAGWPTASKVHFVTYQLNSSSAQVAGTQLDCSGIVSGNTIGSITVIDGTDTGNSVNDVVEMIPTAAWGQDLADALTNQHSRTGTHTVISATSITTTGNSSIGGNETVTGNLAVTGTTTLTGATTITALSNPYKFSVYLGSSISSWSSSGAYKKAQLDTKLFDSGTNFDATTNYRFTAPVAGFYNFGGEAVLNNATNAFAMQIELRKNGSSLIQSPTLQGAGLTNTQCMISAPCVQLSVNDYIELWVFSSGGSWGLLGGGPAYSTWLQGYLVSAT